jgi:hypothetical protein
MLGLHDTARRFLTSTMGVQMSPASPHHPANSEISGSASSRFWKHRSQVTWACRKSRLVPIMETH